MGLCGVPGISTVCHLAGGATKAIAGSAFQAVVDAFAKGLANIMKALMTFWIHTPAPDLSPTSAVLSTLDQLTRPLVAFGALVGLIVGGVRLALAGRQSQESAQAILRGLFLMATVTAAGTVVVETMLTGFDKLAVAILDNGFDGKSVGEQLVGLGVLPGVGGGLVFILAFFGMIASLVQVGVMLVRAGILTVLVGILPIAAAAAITGVGYSWFKRLCGWIGSFALYKLAAAIIYAAAFAMIGSSKDLAGIVSGYSLIILAIFALPALLRLLPPSAEAMGGGGGGGLAAGGAMAATGAVAMSGRSGSAPPAATASPGLKSSAGSSGPSGSAGAAGMSSGAAASLPAAGGKGAAGAGGSSGPAAGAGSGGTSTGGSGGATAGAAGGAGAAGKAAAGAGPAGAALSVASQAHGAAKSASESAIGDGSGGS